MDWNLFFVGGVINICMVLIGFEGSQRLSISAGQIPPRGVKVWHGRPFLHWDDFMMQKVGNLIFFSLLDGVVLMLALSLPWSTLMKVLLGAIGVTNAVITYFWVKSTQKSLANREFNRWDWGFTHPMSELTYAGKYHVVYFWLEGSMLLVALLLLFILEGWTERLMLLGPAIGYGLTAIYDAKKLGMSAWSEVIEKSPD